MPSRQNVTLLNQRFQRDIERVSPQREPLIVWQFPKVRDRVVRQEVLTEFDVTQHPGIGVTGQVFELSYSLPAYGFALLYGIILHSLVPGVQMSRSTAHVERFL